MSEMALLGWLLQWLKLQGPGVMGHGRIQGTTTRPAMPGKRAWIWTDLSVTAELSLRHPRHGVDKARRAVRSRGSNWKKFVKAIKVDLTRTIDKVGGCEHRIEHRFLRSSACFETYRAAATDIREDARGESAIPNNVFDVV